MAIMLLLLAAVLQFAVAPQLTVRISLAPPPPPPRKTVAWLQLPTLLQPPFPPPFQPPTWPLALQPTRRKRLAIPVTLIVADKVPPLAPEPGFVVAGGGVMFSP